MAALELIKRALSIGQVERNLLYHFINELQTHQIELEEEEDDHDDDDKSLQHLDLFTQYITTAYASTTSRLAAHTKNHRITYDLLWALFRPNSPIHTTILDMEKAACYKYVSGKQKTKHGSNVLPCGMSLH